MNAPLGRAISIEAAPAWSGALDDPVSMSVLAVKA